MLLNFRVKNFRSIKDELELSLIKANGTELQENFLSCKGNSESFDVLKSATILGPNASGKSNILRAMVVMRRIVLSSFQHGITTDIQPFKLDTISAKDPTSFDVSIFVDNVRYQYGFSLTNDRVVGEWLYAFPNKLQQTWLERNWIESEGEYEWKLGSKLSGQKNIWKDSTRKDALFLSTAIQLNSKQLEPIFRWFKNNLNVIGDAQFTLGYTIDFCKERGEQKILRLMNDADINFSSFKIAEEKLSEQDPRLYINGPDIKTFHINNEGKLVEFDFYLDESQGTKYLFSLSGPILDTLENGRVLLIDELNTHLHPVLVKYLVERFHNQASNPNGAQLIFTTHETSILNKEVFRRDQIWFCDKDKKTNSTTLFPLTDFSPKKNKENFEAFYRQGRYGALPVIYDYGGENFDGEDDRDVSC